MKQATTLLRRGISRASLAAVWALFLSAAELTAFAAENGGGAAAAKTANMSIIYGVTTVLSLLLCAGYCALVRRKNVWALLLYASVVVVNLGYFALSVSRNLGEALLANRISYLGSVFLPLSMLMIILDACCVSYRRWVPGALLFASVAVFLLAASPGYLICYYREVSLTFVHGMAKLDKTYGPLHFVYLIYLLAYFGTMIGTLLASIVKERAASHKHAALLLTIVFLNIAIWFIEQLISSDFEFLSVSYMVSELFLLMLYGMMQDYGISPGFTRSRIAPAPPPDASSPQEVPTGLTQERIAQIMSGWPAVSMLTAREVDVLRALLENKKRREIAEDLSVTEHTVKKHTANIFSKLDVTSRSELFAKADRETQFSS